MRARAWFGAAVAMHMQREDETAIDAFKKAADMAPTGGKRSGGRSRQLEWSARRSARSCWAACCMPTLPGRSASLRIQPCLPPQTSCGCAAGCPRPRCTASWATARLQCACCARRHERSQRWADCAAACLLGVVTLETCVSCQLGPV